MPEILDMLRREHANTATLLRTLEWQIAAFHDDTNPDYGVIGATLDYFLDFPDLYHHPKEDLIFDRLHLRDRAAAERIGDLRHAHEILTLRLREFAEGIHAVLGEIEVSRAAVTRWALGFIDEQRAHMEMEETIFFPAAERALTAEDWRELGAQAMPQDDPVFGVPGSARFEALRRSILAWQAQDEAVSAAR